MRFNELIEFYEEWGRYLSHSDRAQFDGFISDYVDNHNEMLDDSVYFDPTDYSNALENVFNDYSVTQAPNVVSTALYLDDDFQYLSVLLDDSINQLKGALPLIETLNHNVNIKPLDERVYPNKALVRRRRKQWGGTPNYKTFELNPRKSKGYALRSIKRQLPNVDGLSIKRATERMKRSISHIHIKADLTGFETQSSRLEVDLYDTFKHFGYCLFEQIQEDTSNKKDAWDFAMPSGALDDFLADKYAPTISAFADLKADIQAFVASEWNKYSEKATNAREHAHGYHLTREDVANLQDADLSYLKGMM